MNNQAWTEFVYANDRRVDERRGKLARERTAAIDVSTVYAQHLYAATRGGFAPLSLQEFTTTAQRVRMTALPVSVDIVI